MINRLSSTTNICNYFIIASNSRARNYFPFKMLSHGWGIKDSATDLYTSNHSLNIFRITKVVGVNQWIIHRISTFKSNPTSAFR
ncbi:hypothetical protein TMS3_0120725 [Pseudomonas taeanensis MS-3]|uniref:Uncharacterized protein n=1 Tax=Pseudomonas taeanensis MS-3 TaxID=1395571 RepID=A0A0A1YHL5_9PSED|nr:hypothetical protein TMS3_0120725 [Pseudomonas taeanensis MS-3]